jgi:hypothetical protein
MVSRTNIVLVYPLSFLDESILFFIVKENNVRFIINVHFL